jgi:hypothetical protein
MPATISLMSRADSDAESNRAWKANKAASEEQEPDVPMSSRKKRWFGRQHRL